MEEGLINVNSVVIYGLKVYKEEKSNIVLSVMVINLPVVKVKGI
jgi:hypothetical protein